MRVTFVRHGESEANISGRWQGHGDSPLSARGREQAARAAARLVAARFARIVSSDLSRARETARALGREPELDPGLREVHVGAWEGLDRDEVLARFPEEIAALVRGDDVRIGGGESWSEATARSRAALEAHLARQAEGDELAVFSHGGIITSLFIEMVGAKHRRPQPLGHLVNTAISVARFTPEGSFVERYNDASHVPEAAPWRRKMFGPSDTLIGLLAVDPSTDLEAIASARPIFDEVEAVLAQDTAMYDAAARVARALRVPLDEGAGNPTPDTLAERHPARRIVVVCSPEHATRTARAAIAHIVPDARLAPLPPATLSHVARTRSSTLLADYGAVMDSR